MHRPMIPRLIDGYSGAGGCSVGYHRAGFACYGNDVEPHPDYPFPFHLGDALTMLDRLIAGDAIDFRHPDGTVEWLTWNDFAASHWSPPCKSENDLRHLSGREHPDLLTPTLTRLRDVEKPWVVENVDSTDKLPGALMLCGAAFGLGAACRDGAWRPLRRHRLFASNVWLMGPGCACGNLQPLGVYGTGGGGQQTRGYRAHPEEAREAMGIDWMNREDICQAIPPAYTQFIGGQLLDHLAMSADREMIR